MDTVDSFSNLKKYCSKFSPELLVDLSDNHVIKMMKLNGFPPDIEFLLLIKDDFRIEVYVQHTKVDTRDLLHGFSCTVTRYSAIDNVLDRRRNTPVNVGVELKYLESNVLESTNELEWTDVRHRQITFTGKQLVAFDCNRYSQDDMSDAINLYLRSRNSYRALREILVLPNRNTIY